MQMIDNNAVDDKIIAVAAQDMNVNHIDDISQLPQHAVKEDRSFFEDYKKLENKEVRVEDFLDRRYALTIIKKGLEDYKAIFT